MLDEEDGASRHESGAGDSFVNTPTTTALSPDSDFSGGPNSFYDDIQFIQYTSQDLQLDMRKKTAKIVGRYVMGDILGEGSYGKVKEGFCIETLKRVAIKIMKQSRLKKIPNGEANVKREIALLKQLRHKNIIELMDVITNSEKHKIYVIFEYCASTLSDLLGNSRSVRHSATSNNSLRASSIFMERVLFIATSNPVIFFSLWMTQSKLRTLESRNKSRDTLHQTE